LADTILRCTGAKAPLRFILIDLTETANKIIKQHQASNLPAKLMAETAISSLFLSASLKNQGTVSVEANFSGDISMVKADSSPLGLVRAMMYQDEIRKLDRFEPAIAPDVLRVTKTSEKGKTLSEGIVELEGPFMGRNLAAYLLQSEQIRSAVAIEAKVNEEDPTTLDYAIGYYVEAFPDCTEKELIIMEEVIKGLPELASFNSSQGYQIKELLDHLAGPFQYVIHREITPNFYCTCSKKRTLQQIGTLPKNELISLQKDKSIEVICDFCRQKYQISKEEIGKLIKD
jgi:molecular chaperone Hsp33